MTQRTKFWLAMAIITIICYFDFYLFGEGYGVRKVSSVARQAGHLATLLAVLGAGYWAWQHHPLKWLNKLWVATYTTGIVFILIIGALKTFTGILGDDFLEWAATVRLFFCTPLPHLLLYMLSLIAVQKENS